MSMDKNYEVVAAGIFKQKCLAIIDAVAKNHKPIIISKRGKPVALLMPLESEQEIEERILAGLRSGSGGMLVDEKTFLEPTNELAGWTEF